MINQCTACHEPYAVIMENHLVTSRKKDYVKVYIEKIGSSKSLMVETCINDNPTIQMSDAPYCPCCGGKLND